MAKILELDDLLGKPKNRVSGVGVELEGGWKQVPAGVQLEGDGSVFRGARPAGLQVGELPIGPMQVAGMPGAMRKYYPSTVDDSCGMHVHMSFDTPYQYVLLADSPAYQDTVIEYLWKWGKEEVLGADHRLWPRLEGKSVFCQKKFWPQEQMQTQKKDHDQQRFGHRYTAIHYCWERNRTVECRVLPMFDTVEQSIRAIRRLIDVTNAYLVRVDKSRLRVDGKLELPNGDVYEEFEVSGP